jgi:hypothetical protein
MLLGVAALVAALLAPGTASAALEWRDGGAGIPATVKLNDVARDGETIVVVGSETVTADDGSVTQRAAIYRRVAGVWQSDPLLTATGAPVVGELVDVAAAGGVAWAVGTAGGAPLLAHLPAATASPAAPASWAVVPAPGTAKPRSVTFTGTTGWIGDEAGKLWKLDGANVAATSVDLPTGAAVNGLALKGDKALAVTNGAATTDQRIFGLTSGSPVAGPEPAIPDDAGLSLLSVAAGGLDALAVDDAGYWQLDGQTWKRANPATLGIAGAHLSDVSIATQVNALAGRVGDAGYVWRRRAAQDAWTPEPVSDAPINGVAAVGADDVWAVGDRGVVKHLVWVDPPTVPVPGPGPEPVPAPSGSGPGPTTTTTSSGTTITTIPPAKPGDPTIYVVEPGTRPRPGARPRPHRRLLDRVAVVRRPRALIVSFRLLAAARVSIAAKRGRALVARARSRAMRAGRRRVVLRFTGRPPTALRIVVTPLRARRAGTGTRGGSAGA